MFSSGRLPVFLRLFSISWGVDSSWIITPVSRKWAVFSLSSIAPPPVEITVFFCLLAFFTACFSSFLKWFSPF